MFLITPVIGQALVLNSVPEEEMKSHKNVSRNL